MQRGQQKEFERELALETKIMRDTKGRLQIRIWDMKKKMTTTSMIAIHLGASVNVLLPLGNAATNITIMGTGHLGRLRAVKRGSMQQRLGHVMRCLEPNAKGSLPARDEDHDSVSKMKAAEEALESKQKQKPSFELSGKLAEETNRVKGITLLFTEPPDARKPDIRWRLYVFKAGEVLNEPLYVHRQSCYLFGRERRVADVPTDHPSCSKQHAVIQFRLVEKEGADGLMKKQVRPYLMDLGSTNGTFINDNQIEPQRYYELFEKDTIRFGNSSREYVLLHENSTT
ncbi:unnamed protein product [Victoria cruziana]